MISNLNDLISLIVIVALLFYIFLKVNKAISLKRLTKRIRDEEKYYRDWENFNQ